MTRLAAALLVLALAAPTGWAAGSSQLRQSVDRDLKQFGFRNVDVETLTPAQLTAIHTVASGKRRSGQRGIIRSILGGRNTVRGLFR